MRELMIVEDAFDIKDKGTAVIGKHDFKINDIKYLASLIGKQITIINPNMEKVTTDIVGIEAKSACFVPDSLFFAICLKGDNSDLKLERGSVVSVIDL